jgi:hypothetical protein
MRIAFDLDDTLIAGAYPFPVEERGFLGRLFAHEEIRKGTVPLMRSLIEDGWDVWIYTTSFRGPLYLKSLFRLHGIRIAGVINQHHHTRRVSRCGKSYQDCSKYPPAFGIDLLVDESEGVWLESRRHGFAMVLVRPDDESWADAVLARARRSSHVLPRA